MINGSVTAPFRHDSTWPDGVQQWFRKAVYYRHVPVPGCDPVNHLRELIELVRHRGEPRDTLNRWKDLKRACNKVVHGATEGINDQQMPNLVTNLLVFANLLLIRDYGLEASSLGFETDELARKEEYEMKSKAAGKRFAASIHQAYESLENAIEKLKQSNGQLRDSLKLEKEEAVLSSIPSSHHVINAQDVSKGTFVFAINSTDNCGYMFYSHDPIGWVRISGTRANDKFADDDMSSEMTFRK